MTINLRDEQDDPLEPQRLVALGEAVLRGEGYDPDVEVDLTLVSEQRMETLNAEFMARSGPTDVLAFPLEDLNPGQVPLRRDGDPPVSLGDVMISPTVVRRQAGDAGIEFDDEMALMVTHGILHLMGYDHQADDDAEAMEGRERELLAAAGRVRP